jgi:hypothetical protein
MMIKTVLYYWLMNQSYVMLQSYVLMLNIIVLI